MRVDGWQEKFSGEIVGWLRRPFSYGESDCFQFTASVVSAITGVDYRERFPKYESRETAEDILALNGGASGIVSSVFGEMKPPLHALAGDVIVADFGFGPTAGICVGPRICAPGPCGLIFLDLDHATAAWSV